MIAMPLTSVAVGFVSIGFSPLIKTWFTEGEDDPRITVIRVRPTEGYYWDTKHGLGVAGVKMLIGAALGKTMDDSIQGRLDV